MLNIFKTANQKVREASAALRAALHDHERKLPEMLAKYRAADELVIAAYHPWQTAAAVGSPTAGEKANLLVQRRKERERIKQEFDAIGKPIREGLERYSKPVMHAIVDEFRAYQKLIPTLAQERPGEYVKHVVDDPRGEGLRDKIMVEFEGNYAAQERAQEICQNAITTILGMRLNSIEEIEQTAARFRQELSTVDYSQTETVAVSRDTYRADHGPKLPAKKTPGVLGLPTKEKMNDIHLIAELSKQAQAAAGPSVAKKTLKELL